VFMAAVILLGVWLVARDLRASRDRLKPVVFALMLGESIVLALVFGLVVGTLTAQLLGSLHALSIVASQARPMGIAEQSWPMRLMLSLGAGLYEELFFRVLLVTALAAGARIVLGLGRRGAGIVAALVGAFVFSAFHYIGPY